MSLQSTLFGSTSYKPIAISKALQASTETTAGKSLDRYREKKGGILDKYGALSERILPKAEAATDLGQEDLSAASRKLQSFDPVAVYERLRGGNLGALTGLTDMLSGVGRRQEAQAAARLGLAGRPRSAARDILRSSSLASAFSPVAGQIFAGLGTDTSNLGSTLTGQSKELRALAAARPDLYKTMLQLGLAPLEAEQMGLAGETSALNALADAVKKNYAGMDVNKKMGIMDYVTGITGGLAETAGNLGDAYMGIMSGGILGRNGAAGGILGGGGGRKTNPDLTGRENDWLDRAYGDVRAMERTGRAGRSLADRWF